MLRRRDRDQERLLHRPAVIGVGGGVEGAPAFAGTPARCGTARAGSLYLGDRIQPHLPHRARVPLKLRELINLIGLRPRPKRYGFEVLRFHLPEDGLVEYAQWLHPREAKRRITAASVARLRELVGEGDFCIDIGAHSGDTTIPMALAVGRSGCVLALEPNGYVYPVLEENSRLNRDKTNIVPWMVAATPENGEVVFEYSDAGFCNGGRHEGISRWKHAHAFELKVQGVNLARALRERYADRLPRLKLIKTDAEGYDLPVVRSLADVIEEYRPYVLSEVFRHTGRPYRVDLLAFFEERGYAVYRPGGDGNLRETRLTTDLLMERRHYDVFAVPE